MNSGEFSIKFTKSCTLIDRQNIKLLQNQLGMACFRDLRWKEEFGRSLSGKPAFQ